MYRLLSAILTVLLTMFLCFGCAQHQYAVPKGFAAYKDTRDFKAVSPEGILFRIRQEPNKPVADLPFWKEALKNRMLDSGYQFIDDSDIKAGNRNGYLLELAAPFGNKDYIYLMAIFLDDKEHIIIAEAAGEVVQFNQHRKEIIDAIQAIKI